MTAPAFDPFRETLLQRRPIHEGRLLKVFDDEVRLEDGRIARREVAEHPGAVCVIAVDSSARIALVRQWRHPVGRGLWELPAGTRDKPGEAPAKTAMRELAEEVGVAASSWRELTSMPLAPGYSSEVMQFFLASGISRETAAADEDEQLEVAWLTVEEIGRLVASGDVDVKTVAGLTLAGYPVHIDG